MASIENRVELDDFVVPNGGDLDECCGDLLSVECKGGEGDDETGAD